MRIDVDDLTPIERTALLTLYARALDSRWQRPILGDTLADASAQRSTTTSRESVWSPASCASRRYGRKCSTSGRVSSSPSTPTPSWSIWVPVFKISARIPAMARKARILRYRF
jgi:hypothetical protein